jgi:hypothetical protein
LALLASPDFKKINLGLTERNRNVQFVKVGTVLEKIKGIIGWANDWVSARDRKAEAFLMGSQRPLEEVKVEITAKEQELEDIRNSKMQIEDEIWNVETKGEDSTALKNQISELANQEAMIELELAGLRERKEELENILQQSMADIPDPVTRQLFLNEVIYPVLESLKSIRSYGLRATADGETIQTSVFFDIAD